MSAMKTRICSEHCPYARHRSAFNGTLADDAHPLCGDCPELGPIVCDIAFGRVELKPHWIRSIRMVRAQERREARAALSLIAAE